jgi:charged multivesicular body protein 7
MQTYLLSFYRAQTKAAHHLNLKQKNVALSYLRSKKQLESVLDKQVGAAEQLRSVLRGIENAHGDVEVSLLNFPFQWILM